MINESAGRIIGTGAVRPYDYRFPALNGLLTGGSPVCEMVKFYIDSGCRGQGIGGALYAQAETFARDAGYKECYLHTCSYGQSDPSPGSAPHSLAIARMNSLPANDEQV